MTSNSSQASRSHLDQQRGGSSTQVRSALDDSQLTQEFHSESEFPQQDVSCDDEQMFLDRARVPSPEVAESEDFTVIGGHEARVDAGVMPSVADRRLPGSKEVEGSDIKQYSDFWQRALPCKRAVKSSIRIFFVNGKHGGMEN